MKRSFQPQWYSKWHWLHYVLDSDVACCHMCVCVKLGKIRNLGTGDLAFVTHGYCNWKDATGTKGSIRTVVLAKLLYSS